MPRGCTGLTVLTALLIMAIGATASSATRSRTTGHVVSGTVDARDRGAALGFVNAMTDLPSVTRTGDKLYVFALP